MNSRRKAVEDFMKSSTSKDEGMKKKILPRNSLDATCAVIARWFNDIISERRVVPDIEGNLIFTVPYSSFLIYTGYRRLTSTIRKKLLTRYGFKLNKLGIDLVITKRLV